MKKITALLLISIGMLQSCQKKEPVTGTNKALNDLLENYHQERLKLYPLEATTSGDARYNDLFPNTLSDEYRSSLMAFYTKYNDSIASYKENDLTENDLISLQILKWQCDNELKRLTFHEEYLPMDQFNALPLQVGQLASGSGAQPFKTVNDYENWLKRLHGFNQWLISAKSRMEEGVAKGYVIPKALTLKVIPQLEDMATTAVKSHLYYTPVTMFPDDFSEADKNSLTEKYTAFLKDSLIPSFKNLYEYTKGDYLKASRETSGISALPEGKAYYDFLIKNYTTTDMTADEIHELGLKEVERIKAAMEKIKNEVGNTGDLPSFFDHVRNKPELMPFTEPQQVIDHFNEIHERMKPNLEKLFGNKPKTPFEVRQTEAFREASASAEYIQGSVDGTRPGVFYVPIPNVKKYNVFADEDLFLHEAIPGHHYQVSLQQENNDLPNFRKTIWFNAYGEGWALYTESLGNELGLYTDPYQYFGMLSAEMHRAIRLVVDTGIHTKGWTREQAIKYSLENEAEPEESIIAEIERYMAIPGQALSYKIGQLKIRELRNRAEKELGDKFDIKEYHNQVLNTGCLPLKVLEDKIDKWIVGKK